MFDAQLARHHGHTRELQQAMWEVIAEMERAQLQGDNDQMRRLKLVEWGCLE